MSALHVQWSVSRPCCFNSEEADSGIHCVESWKNPRTGWSIKEKKKNLLLLPGTNPSPKITLMKGIKTLISVF
jgi:hypothetical protein